MAFSIGTGTGGGGGGAKKTPTPMPVATPQPRYTTTPQPPGYSPVRFSTPTPPGYMFVQEEPTPRPVQTPTAPAPTFYGFNPARYPAPAPNSIYSNFGYAGPSAGTSTQQPSIYYAEPGYESSPLEPAPIFSNFRYNVPSSGTSTQQPGLNVGAVPNMPEGYGYANGFPFRGNQVPGWNIGNAAVPNWAKDSTGFNWADVNAYNNTSAAKKGPAVKFNEQGKDKGLDTYNKISNLAKNMATAAFQQYRTNNLNTWGPWYDAALGKGNYDTQHWWTPQDYNNLANMFVDSAGNPVEMGIQALQPTTRFQSQGTSAYMNTLAGRMSEAQKKMSLEWLRRYGPSSGIVADTYLGQADRLAQRLTAKPKPVITSGGSSGSYGYGGRYGYGGGGGGWGDYNGGSSYTPSWYNGLLSWRI